MRRSSWRDELPPEALAVLDSAEVDECSDAAFERIGKRVALGLGVGAAVSGAAGAAQAAGTAGTVTAGASLGGHALTTWLGLALGVGMTITAVQVLRPDAPEVAAPTTASPSSTPPAPRAQANPTPEVVPTAPTRDMDGVDASAGSRPLSAPSEPQTDPAPVTSQVAPRSALAPSRRRPARARAASPATTERPIADLGVPTERSPSRLAEELSLMRRLRSAVQRDPRRALSLASEHASRFGDASSFSAERELYRVQALAHLGERTRAESRARQFRQRFPGSPYAAAIEAALRSNALTPAEPGSP